MTALASLPAERPGFAAPPDIAGLRAQLATVLPPPPQDLLLGGCSALRIGPERPAARVLHFHGGGFRIGAPEVVRDYAERLSAATGAEVVLPRYRLAPENPFPAGLNDALACLIALADEAPAVPIIVAGDSAGGALAAGLAAMASAGQAPAVAGVILHSAWLDLTVSAPAYAENAATDPLFSRKAAEVAAGLYLQGADPTHALVSPLFAVSGGPHPPVLVTVGSGEVLRDDSIDFSQRLQALDGKAKLLVVKDMEHVAVVRGAGLTGSAEAFAETVRFIDAVVSGDA